MDEGGHEVGEDMGLALGGTSPSPPTDHGEGAPTPPTLRNTRASSNHIAETTSRRADLAT